MRRGAVVLTIVALAAAAPYLLQQRYATHIAITMCIALVMALSTNLMLRVGQLSVAQVAFMGMGAYTSALLSMRLGYSTAASVALGGLVAGAFAVLLGPVFLRIKGVYFVLLTFAFTHVVNLTFQEWTSVFGGNNGLSNIPKLQLLGVTLGTPLRYYSGTLALAALCTAGMLALQRSHIGAVLQSIEENETLAWALGVNVLAWRVACFGASAVMAGLAGAAYAHYIGFLSPEVFTFHAFVNHLVINVIGGLGSPFGPLVGTLLIVPLPEMLRDAQQYELLAYGAILIVFIAFFPNGLMGFVADREGSPRKGLRARLGLARLTSTPVSAAACEVETARAAIRDLEPRAK